MRLVLFEPDIAGNVGAAIRIAACLGARLEIIEPCGFPLKAADLKRAAMDYGDPGEIIRHASFAHFAEDLAAKQGRLILLTTRGSVAHHTISYAPSDTLLIGRESAGVPEAVHQAADLRVRIPMAEGARSLNMAVSAAIVLAEANRQLGL